MTRYRLNRLHRKKFSYNFFLIVFLLSFIFFSVFFVRILVEFPDRPRVQTLFETINRLNIPILKEFAISTPSLKLQPLAFCGDSIDNDGDGRIDYPADRGCESSNDADENFGDLNVPENRIPRYQAGVEGGVPDTSDSVAWKQYGSVIPAGSSVTTIQNAIYTASGIALSPGQKGWIVQLDQGTYNFGIEWKFCIRRGK